jgi:mitochondrial fission protein ELM1
VVTADSVNLISEACASGKPVLIAGSRQAKGKIGGFCRRMIQEAYARPLEDIDASSDPLAKTRCLRETKNIARQLIQSGLFN